MIKIKGFRVKKVWFERCIWTDEEIRKVLNQGEEVKMKTFEEWKKFKENKLAKARLDVAKTESELESPDFHYNKYLRQCGADKKKIKQDELKSDKKSCLSEETPVPIKKEKEEAKKDDWF